MFIAELELDIEKPSPDLERQPPILMLELKTMMAALLLNWGD